MKYNIPNMEYNIPNMEYNIPNMEYNIPSMEYNIPNIKYNIKYRQPYKLIILKYIVPDYAIFQYFGNHNIIMQLSLYRDPC